MRLLCRFLCSLYGHVKTLVDAAVEGLKKAGAEVAVFRCPETLPAEVLEKMGAASLKHNEGVPVVDMDTWTEADGFLFACVTLLLAFSIPFLGSILTPSCSFFSCSCGTRYGGTTAQFRSFVDATGGAWAAGKCVYVFCLYFGCISPFPWALATGANTSAYSS
jgi:NAD(P)H dehydrogenase (quinone)